MADRREAVIDDDAVESGEVTAPEGETGQSLAEQISGPYRAVAGFLNRRSLARATRSIPRTLGFVGSALLRGEVSDALPAPHLSVGLAAQVAMDEALLAIAMTPKRFPLPSDFRRVADELAEAELMYAERGWLADPRSYHRDPSRLDSADVSSSRGWAMGLGYERIDWESEFATYPGEPGSERWMRFKANQTATATIVRHADGPRPWVIAVHGFCMGFPFMDFSGLQVERIHRELGMNVAMPTLPLHGHRRATRISGEPFMSFELMNAVHGIAQAAFDIRRLISWVQDQGATSISLYGVSLGGYVVSLLAGLDDRIDAVVAGIPVSDFPELFHRHSPGHLRARAIEHRIMGGAAENVFRVVSPLSFDTQIPKDRRFIFAGYGDRLATPPQAQRLWEHWDEPEISWYAGNHVGYLWSKKVADFLVSSLAEVDPSFGLLLARG